jgi:hypothetical protein
MKMAASRTETRKNARRAQGLPWRLYAASLLPVHRILSSASRPRPGLKECGVQGRAASPDAVDEHFLIMSRSSACAENKYKRY